MKRKTQPGCLMYAAGILTLQEYWRVSATLILSATSVSERSITGSGPPQPTAYRNVDVPVTARLDAEVDFESVAFCAVICKQRDEVGRPDDVVSTAIDNVFV
jgi:hypothetical protein